MLTKPFIISCDGYELMLSGLRTPPTSDEIRIIKQLPPEGYELAKLYATHAFLWNEHVDLEASTDFDAMSETERLVLALLVIGRKRIWRRP